MAPGGMLLTAGQYDSAGLVAVALHPHVPAPSEPCPHGPVLPVGQHVSKRLHLST